MTVENSQLVAHRLRESRHREPGQTRTDNSRVAVTHVSIYHMAGGAEIYFRSETRWSPTLCQGYCFLF